MSTAAEAEFSDQAISLARAPFERASACDDDGDRARANELLRRVADAIEATNPTGGLGAALLWGQAEMEQLN